MKLLLLLVVVALGRPSSSSHVIPVGVTVGLRSEYFHPIKSLYHSQDAYGQYLYGYSTPTISQSETKSADGVTQGGYSYIDADGILQTVQYTADAVHGFRVAASNLPRDSAEVAHAKAEHLAQFNQIAAERTVKYSNPVAVPIAQVPQLQVLPQPVQDLPEVARARAEHLAILQAAYQNQLNPPQPVQDLPEVVKARAEHLAVVEQTKARDLAINISPVPQNIEGAVVPVHTAITGNAAYAHAVPHQYVSYTPALIHTPASSQYHSQDGLGQYSYGYISPLSSKSETKSADGVTRGGYSYIDANGILQTVSYVSDAVHGFRVAATNLPKTPKTTLVAPGEPIVVQKAAVAAPVVAPKITAVGDGALYTQEVWYGD